MDQEKFIPHKDYKEYSPTAMIERSKIFYESIRTRRSIRTFSNKSIPLEVIENCIRVAGSAPSGANLQPWRFVVISNSEIKKKIREAAEKEEKELYSARAPQEWLDVLRPLGTNEQKPFLETAPYLIVIFEKKYEEESSGRKKLYFTKESVGIAAGFLITAIHNAGLVSLTHTPSPMNFLNEILQRPNNEKPFLILVVGFPSENATVPDIKRKSLEEIATFIK